MRTLRIFEVRFNDKFNPTTRRAAAAAATTILDVLQIQVRTTHKTKKEEDPSSIVLSSSSSHKQQTMVPFASTAATAIGKKINLVVLYGIGGLSDVGRHAILAALEPPYADRISKITVVTEYPELLDEHNWECGCDGGHPTNPSKTHADKVEIVPIDGSWNDETKNYGQTVLEPLFRDIMSGGIGGDGNEELAVISCLGHRQPGWKYKNLITRGLVANSGSKQLLDALQKTTTTTTKKNQEKSEESENKPIRTVVISSVGIQEDWPPFESTWPFKKIMSYLLKGPAKLAAQDLTDMETQFHKTTPDDIDYLFVRPVGISEDARPEGEWTIQKEKYKDTNFEINMAKMDVARFMVSQIVQPTYHRKGVVIGGKKQKKKEKAKTKQTMTANTK
jgi:NAD(P)H-binding